MLFPLIQLKISQPHRSGSSLKVVLESHMRLLPSSLNAVFFFFNFKFSILEC